MTLSFPTLPLSSSFSFSLLSSSSLCPPLPYTLLPFSPPFFFCPLLLLVLLSVPSGEVKPEFSSSSWPCDSGSGSVRRVYLSQKARISYRHQMDNVIDATY